MSRRNLIINTIEWCFFFFFTFISIHFQSVKKPPSESSSLSSIEPNSAKKDRKTSLHKEDDKKSTHSPSILKRVKRRRASGSTTTAPEGSSLNHYPENLHHQSLGSIENQYPKSIKSQFGYVLDYTIWVNIGFTILISLITPFRNNYSLHHNF